MDQGNRRNAAVYPPFREDQMRMKDEDSPWFVRNLAAEPLGLAPYARWTGQQRSRCRGELNAAFRCKS